jgi:hypothetical protein
MTNPFRVPGSTCRRVAIPLALALSVSACAGPVGPSAAPVPQAETLSGSVSPSTDALWSSRAVTTFPLLNGTFTLSLRTADGTAGTIKGTYSGEATAVVPGNTTATLEMQISETSGYGSAISGLLAEGSGAFVGEGDFSLTVSLSSAARQDVKATLRGTSRLSCAASQRILVTQHARASTPKFVELTIDMQHEVGRTGCSS